MVCEFNSTGDIFRVEEVFERGQCIMGCYFDIMRLSCRLTKRQNTAQSFRDYDEIRTELKQEGRL